MTARHAFAQRLHEYADFAFGGDDVFLHRGHWYDIFAGRIGPAFGGRVVFEIGCADAEFVSRVAAKHRGRRSSGWTGSTSRSTSAQTVRATPHSNIDSVVWSASK